MKAFFITLTLLVFGVSSAMAQTERGGRLMGVNVGNITIPTSGGSGTIISLQPTYGWFVGDGLALGAGIPFLNVSSNGTRATQIGIAPFLRYYIGSSQIKPFLGASVGVINSSSSFNGGNSDSSTDALYSFTGGVAFFINRSVSFDLGLTYTGGQGAALNTLLVGTPNALTPNVPKALNITLGFQVYFGK
ncbi:MULTISPECIES: outer membrane beta-barrel protein [unclassified Spirosoma]|uniref:outer membrane beta-barrel protein n=1 Tax=unclassified Spirosoma TaxID=2621999 RepID=UPI00096188BE|nr:MULTISPECIES: outer membrane beta-barrel protein [unclassified Spirosoma]MBN8821639.1 outer membrane beta-barrel protein [Spirosoma sp.]OJW80864.1 MAG: hypothetical protein BGO59_35995 [Spirosoma sp. 48-14]